MKQRQYTVVFPGLQILLNYTEAKLKENTIFDLFNISAVLNRHIYFDFQLARVHRYIPSLHVGIF